MKGPTEKHFDGVYGNPRLMHAIGQVVGCIVLVQVKSGSFYEGVLKTISNKADFVLEIARKVENIKSPHSDASAVGLISTNDKIFDKLVFKMEDIVSVNATNIDHDFATKDGFTDTGISKFNGQVVEKELEPWDGGASSDGLPDLGGNGGEEEANGWDANDMFRTNEEKYGVKSNFDSTLPGYTIPLTKQNTEEYKQQEAKASKIAQEIESSLHHRNRAALENGDEEDKYSAVHRPDNNANSFRFVSHRSKKGPARNNIRNNPPPPHMNRNSHHHTQGFHNRVSSPALNNSQGSYKVVNSVSNCVNTISPRPTPTSTPPTSRQPPMPAPVPFQQVQTPPSAGIAQAAPRATPPTTPTMPAEESHKMNGEADKTEIKFAPKPPRSLNLQTAANKEMRDSVANQQVLNKNIERRKDIDKKTPVQKARDDKTEELKRFHSRFKLSDENKEGHEKEASKSDSQPPVSSVSQSSSKYHSKEKNKEEDGSRKMVNTPESRTSPENPKNSSLNPNAKEFVLNPNAKTFTPRVNLNNAPPPVQHRLHTQSPIMAMPQPHIMPGMAQTVFNMAPHYVVSAGPGSVPMNPPFPPAASVTQPPRFRKTAMPMTLQRHDLSQPVHVQAATGQPILAHQPTLSAGPQFAIQYAPSPGMLHPPPGPPQQLAYTQMYSIMPRVLTPQPVGMVPTSAAYGDNSQIPTHVYMSHPGNPGLQQHPMANSGQHSAPSTPQSQTPNLHPAPSPVHQPPGGHGQPPTPTGHNAPTPQPVMYTTHGHMAAQHPMHHGNHTSSNQGHPFATYPGTAQPIVLLPQQHHGQFAPSLQNHLHGGQNPGSHTPTHVLPHMTMIPTSAGMVHTQTAISTGHYVPHTQGRSANNSSIHAKRKLHRTKNN